MSKLNWHNCEKEKLLKWQAKTLRNYLSNVVHPFSSYYREFFDAHNFNPKDIRYIEDIRHLPFTSKSDIAPSAEHPQTPRDFIIIPDKKVLSKRLSVIASSFLKGRANTQKKLEREYRPIFMTSTTGRSAEPTPFFYTKRDLKNLEIAGGRLTLDKLAGAFDPRL